MEITTALSDDENVIGCDAYTDNKMELFNSLYSRQYYLHNTSSESGSIKAEFAWGIASGLGENITVAVIDTGVDHNHEDLPNILDGYTVGDPSGNGDPINPSYINNKAHGISCAGIIGASNDSVGIRGIAPNVKIIPVNIFENDEYDDEDTSQAIDWAKDRADVLSCSWGTNRKTYNICLFSAINDAMTYGRNGKGCVVVFASGNFAQNSNVNGLAFPASMDGVISVGAIDRDGSIWNYSQRGKGLSLVAPSGNGNSPSDIVTTDRMDGLNFVMSEILTNFVA